MTSLLASCNAFATKHRQVLSTIMALSCLALVVVLMPSVSHAGTGTGPLDTVYTTFMGWTEGNMGRLIAAIFAIVGIVAGIARQSIIAFVMCFGVAIGFANLQAILSSVMTATL